MLRRAHVVAAVALAVAGCGPVHHTYTIRPLPVTVMPGSGPDWDVDIRVDFSQGMLVTLENHSPYAIRVLWDECAYIDIDNQSHRVLTTTGQRAGQHAPQTAAVLAPGTRLQEVLYPVAHWKDSGVDPILPASRPSLISPAAMGGLFSLHGARFKRLAGRELGLFLVLEPSFAE